MIHNEAELRQTIECREMMRRSLQNLREEVLPRNPRWYELMAEGPLDELKRIDAEINEYLARQAPHSKAS
ncbi:MAG: hypothetical protein M3430_13615 [Acidobacteriota bacterium]|nr:hypothetical protein [Acidobacteriota bacterium]